MTNTFTRVAVRLYRALPVSQAARRKVKAVVLRPFTRGRQAFEYNWRDMRVILYPEQSIDMRLFFAGDYEPETLDAVARLAPKNGTVIDIGANIGLISMWASRCVGPAGRVIAVEPSRWAMARLKVNSELNGMTNMDAVLGASGKAPGEIITTVINGYGIDDKDSTTVESVAVFTIDQIVEDKGLDRVDLIKTDTDGYEFDVLFGARRTLERFSPPIIFELAPTHLESCESSADQLLGFLEGLDYRFFNEAFELVTDVRAFAARIATNASSNLIALPNGYLLNCDPCTAAALHAAVPHGSSAQR